MIPSKRRIRKAYLVMQDPDYQLFTDSVYQELLLALSDQKDKDEKRIDDILDELNLTIYKERHPMSLSGGQKQRTAIGVAALRDLSLIHILAILLLSRPSKKAGNNKKKKVKKGRGRRRVG